MTFYFNFELNDDVNSEIINTILIEYEYDGGGVNVDIDCYETIVDWLEDEDLTYTVDVFDVPYIGDVKDVGGELLDSITTYHDDENFDKYCEYYHNENCEVSWNYFELCYQGEYDSMEEFAEQLFNDLYNIPSYLINHIDWESVSNDLSHDYTYYEGEEFVCVNQ